MCIAVRAGVKLGISLQVRSEVNFLPSRWGVTCQVVQNTLLHCVEILILEAEVAFHIMQ
jgi:hypothetical protein